MPRRANGEDCCESPWAATGRWRSRRCPARSASTHEKARAPATRATGLRSPPKKGKTEGVGARSLPPLPGALPAFPRKTHNMHETVSGVAI